MESKKAFVLNIRKSLLQTGGKKMDDEQTAMNSNGNTLLLSNVPERYKARKHIKKSETEAGVEVSLRHRFVLELHLAGHKPTRSLPGKPSIQELTDYGESTIYKILASPGVQTLKQQVMNYYNQEFEALYPDVIEAVQRGLESGDKYIDAAKLWLSYNRGKPAGEGNGNQINFTAEDMVVQILQMAGDRKKEVLDG